jgi:hypothetical protein
MRFRDILEKLDETLGFCKSLGLSGVLENSRFTEYRHNIARLQDIVSSGTEDSRADKLQKELQEHHLQFVISLTESLELLSTFRYINTIDAKLARYKLRKVLVGPFLPIDEDQNSNEARNTLFELNLASKLAATGFEPTLGEADIEITIQERQVLIECKRPAARKSVRTAIKSGRNQLNFRLKSKPSGSRGIIAVSMSKAINTRDDFLLYSEESSAKEMLGDLVESEANKTKTVWPNLGGKIIGVLFYLSIRSFDRKKEIYALGQQLHFQPCGHTGTDREVFKAFYEKLQPLSV